METCKKCLKPKQASSPGSIAQLFELCRCDDAENSNQESVIVLICNLCKKRVNQGRQGSFTQWIFRQDLCSCPNPEITESIEFIDLDSTVAVDEIGETEEELVDLPDGFPLERYKPLSRIGTGATSEVFLCRDRLLNKKLAIKLLRWITDKQLVSFQNEAKVNAALKHHNIVELLDFGVSGDVPFLVQEYVEGTTLEQYLNDHGLLNEAQAIDLLRQVCSALAYAHKKGIFHRDLKPSNILLTDIDSNSWTVKLIDFGVAHIKKSGYQLTLEQGTTVVGTPNYMSPDQANGLSYDERSEIYSLGCVMYEVLAGQPPFVGETALETLSFHAKEMPVALDDIVDGGVSELLQSIVLKCLEKSPEDRFENIDELRQSMSEVVPIVSDIEVESDSGISIKRKMAIGIVLTILLATGGLCSIAVLVSNKKTPKKRLVKKEIPEKWSKQKSLAELINMPNAGKSNEFIEHLKAHPETKKANFFMCEIGDKDIDFIGSTNLTYLDLSYTDITDKSMNEVAKIASLRRLFLRGCKVGDSGISAISKHSDLNTLDLSAINLSNDAFDSLSNLTSLQVLYLVSSPDLDSYKLKQLGKLPNLKSLMLMRDTLSKEAVGEMAKFPQLRKLSLANCKFDSDALLALKKAPRLRELDISYTNLSKESVEAIAAINSLRTIICQGIPNELVLSLRRKRPDLYILDKEGKVPM